MRATVRFYAELRDFLREGRDSGVVVRSFSVAPSVEDLIESCGVPPGEVDLVLVDGASVDLSHRVAGGARVAVFPVFECFDVASVQRVRSAPLRTVRFILDVHLGPLARYLRLLGFDTLHDQAWSARDLMGIAAREHRILLTRDVSLLTHAALTHGSLVRETRPRRQLLEVVDRFHLAAALGSSSRCMVCNSALEEGEKAEVGCDGCDRRSREGARRAALVGLVEQARGG